MINVIFSNDGSHRPRLPSWIILTSKSFGMNNSVKVVAALGAGLIVGGILGVLFAPAKGSDLRQKIVDEGDELASKLRKKIKAVTEKACDQCEKATSA